MKSDLDLDFYANLEGEEPIEAPTFDSKVEDTKVEDSNGKATEVVEEEPMTYTLGGFGDLSIEGDEEESEGTDGEIGYSIEDAMREESDLIISSIVGDKVIKGYAQDILFNSYTPTLFFNENFVIYTVLYTFRDKINRITIDEEFIKLFLSRNRGILEDNKDRLDISAYGEIDGSNTLGYIGGVLKQFVRLRSMEPVTTEVFETTLEKYKLNYEKYTTRVLLSKGQSILEDGLTIRRKNLFGFFDCAKYLKEGLADIESVLDPVSSGSVHLSLYDLVMNPSATTSKVVSDFGKIHEFNKAYGGIKTGSFYSWIAPPKAGKSKFGAMIVYNAIMRGTNVTVWDIENSAVGFMYQLRAIHFNHFYNDGKPINEKVPPISSQNIRDNNYTDARLGELEKSSATDLVINQEYGRVSFINRSTITAEDFISIIEDDVEKNNSELVLIDYLQMVTSSTGLSQFDTVSKAYRELLGFCHSKNIAVCTPAQMKQETVDKLLESKDPSSIDLRTAGGVSSESVRTPDVLFALCATTQDILNHTMTLLPLPSRTAPAIQKVELNVDYGTCSFESANYVEM